jgi:hypothetical protein
VRFDSARVFGPTSRKTPFRRPDRKTGTASIFTHLKFGTKFRLGWDRDLRAANSSDSIVLVGLIFEPSKLRRITKREQGVTVSGHWRGDVAMLEDRFPLVVLSRFGEIWCKCWAWLFCHGWNTDCSNLAVTRR